MSDETNTYGDEIDLINIDANAIYTDVITSLEQEVGEPLYPGDERRIFAEALVGVLVPLYNRINDAARQVMLRYARGQVLDALGDRTNTHRLLATKATTILRFSVATPHSTDIVIPKWTRVTADGTFYFVTDEIAVLRADTYSIDVSASAIDGGSRYNGYRAGSIVTLTDMIPYISSVTNIQETAGGDDGEPYTTDGDNHYRDRIRLSPSKLSTAGTVEGYIYYAKSADPNICDVSVISDSAGCVTLIPLLDGGEIPGTDILDKVVAVAGADDVRPLTDKVNAMAPEAILYNIEITYYTTSADEAQVAKNIEGEGGALDRYKAWQSSALGRAINPDYLRKLILSPDWGDSLTGATRVTVTAPDYQEITRRQVAKLNSIKVYHSIEVRT